jgi:hypothetical protein
LREEKSIRLLQVMNTVTYASGPAVVRFVRTGGTVRGLTVSNRRSQDVPFERGKP